VSIFDKSVNEIEVILNGKLTALHEKFSDVFTISEYQLNNEYINTIYKIGAIQSEWLKSKMEGVKVNRKLQEIYSAFYAKAKEGQVTVTRPDGKEVNRSFSGETEIKEWIHTLPKYQKIKLYADHQEIVIEYYKLLLDAMQMKSKILHNIQNFDRVY